MEGCFYQLPIMVVYSPLGCGTLFWQFFLCAALDFGRTQAAVYGLFVG